MCKRRPAHRRRGEKSLGTLWKCEVLRSTTKASFCLSHGRQRKALHASAQSTELCALRGVCLGDQKKHLKDNTSNTFVLLSKGLITWARAEPGTSAQTYSGHAKCYWYSLTGCPFRMLSKVILLPVSSSPRLISGIPVTGFRWEANQIHFGRCASSFPLARASLGSQKTSLQRSGLVCREEKIITSRFTPVLGSGTLLLLLPPNGHILKISQINFRFCVWNFR